MNRRHILGITVFLVSVWVLTLPGSAHAATSAAGSYAAGLAPADVMNEIINVYNKAAAPMAAHLQSLAVKLFVVLATIELGWSASRLVLGRGDIADWLVELIQQGVSIGFLFYLLTNFSSLANDVVTGLRDAASIAASGSAANAGNIFASGMQIGTDVINSLIYKLSAIPTDIAMVICAIVIIFMYATIAADILFVVIESKIAVVIGMLFMGLGPSRWTSGYMMKMINYVISVATKLFVMLIVVGIGQSVIQTFAANALHATLASDLSLVGAAVVFVALVKKIPDLIQSVISGAATGASGELTAALAGAAAGAASMAMGGAGLAGAAGEAAQLASAASGGEGAAGALGAAASGGAGESGAGGASSGGGASMGRGQLMARTAGILGRAAMADMQGRLEGDPASRGGTMGGRMARRIRSANTSKSDVPRLTPDP
ncbi:P-type conjugative transfer protein TrbL [Acidocella aminolytica]|uniref:Conjugal transfer protein TrbL n=2 Tax=Acidocella TaxID=50709 RepID=A0A0D6PGP5_9PROT|nr:P-type conjugative transfer protein TrbL [Acidocella aminolytica]GAN80373.1 conjugal transfer protein TrbL [Acidocella aminolytica 101 = DSM 11237]SHF59984.1 type IV secretion system protein TrbL [Acidocella aminolytica 101 = DSM 11237]